MERTIRVKKSSAELKKPSCACRNWQQHYRGLHDLAPAEQILCANPVCPSFPPYCVTFHPVVNVVAEADGKEIVAPDAVEKMVPLCSPCAERWPVGEVRAIADDSILGTESYSSCGRIEGAGILSKLKKWPRPVLWIVGLTLFFIAAYFFKELIYSIVIYIALHSFSFHF